MCLYDQNQPIGTGLNQNQLVQAAPERRDHEEFVFSVFFPPVFIDNVTMATCGTGPDPDRLCAFSLSQSEAGNHFLNLHSSFPGGVSSVRNILPSSARTLLILL